MTSQIKLYGGKGDRFEEIKNQFAIELGYEPTNSEVFGMLMAEFPSENSHSGNDARVRDVLDD